MNRKTTFGRNVLNFLDGKGFYLAVLVCLAAIGVSAWIFARSLPSGDEGSAVGGSVTVSAPVEITEEDRPTLGEDDVLTDDGSQLVSGGAQVEVTLPSQGEGSDAPAEDLPEEDPAADGQEDLTAAAPLVYTWPVKGEVLNAHSGDDLLYDETMGDWRVHPGIDIAAAAGTTVKACAAGTVSAIVQDGLMGTTVIIDHGEDMVSVYSNLQAIPTVSVGDAVYTGDVIGSVGTTAIAESALASHLHFELTCDGSPVDPLDYLPAQ